MPEVRYVTRPTLREFSLTLLAILSLCADDEDYRAVAQRAEQINGRSPLGHLCEPPLCKIATLEARFSADTNARPTVPFSVQLQRQGTAVYLLPALKFNPAIPAGTVGASGIANDAIRLYASRNVALQNEIDAISALYQAHQERQSHLQMASLEAWPVYNNECGVDSRALPDECGEECQARYNVAAQHEVDLEVDVRVFNSKALWDF